MKIINATFFFTLTSFCVFYRVNTQTIIELHEDNWHQILQNEWMVEFYAPWCPACKGLESIWKEFAMNGAELGIKVGQVDVTLSPGLTGRFMITTLPTIFHVFNGEFRHYKGSRDKLSFTSFITVKRWKLVDTIPGWKSPNSVQMSIISSFFKLSQLLRGIHTHFMEEFGLPTWTSYLIFAVLTILLGAILGLILVCVIDFMYPLKMVPVRKVKDRTGKKMNDQLSDEELADEDIKDDLLDDADQLQSEQSMNDASSSSKPVCLNVKKPKEQEAD